MSAAPATAVQAHAAVPSVSSERYVGLVTRAIAFALDAAIINVVAILTAAAISLTLSVVKVPDDVRTVVGAAGGVAYALWTVGYFVTFWATTGQTPGDRVLRIRVYAASSDRLPPRRALLRFLGIVLATVPLFAGFLPILVDARRRGVHDMLARTVVLDAEQR